MKYTFVWLLVSRIERLKNNSIYSFIKRYQFSIACLVLCWIAEIQNELDLLPLLQNRSSV